MNFPFRAKTDLRIFRGIANIVIANCKRSNLEGPLCVALSNGGPVVDRL